MSINPLRAITYLSLILIVIILELLSNLNQKIILSIGLILVFLIVFTYIFKTNGSESLKAAVIVFTFIGLPLFLLWYLDIISSLPGIWAGAAAVGVVLISGIASIITIIRLDYAELVWK